MRSPKSLKSAPMVCSVRLRASTVAATSPGLFDPSRRMSFANFRATDARSVTMVRLDLVLRAKIRDHVVEFVADRALGWHHRCVLVPLRIVRQVGRDDEVNGVARTVLTLASALLDLGVENETVEVLVARELALLLGHEAIVLGIEAMGAIDDGAQLGAAHAHRGAVALEVGGRERRQMHCVGLVEFERDPVLHHLAGVLAADDLALG